MRPEDLLTQTPSPERVAEAARGLPAADPAVLEVLRRDLLASEGPAAAGAGPSLPPWLEALREQLDVRHAGAVHSHRPVLDPALVAVKSAFRLGFQPLINEVLRAQVLFNESVLNALVHLYEQQRETARAQDAWRAAFERRLAALEAERGEAGGPPRR